MQMLEILNLIIILARIHIIGLCLGDLSVIRTHDLTDWAFYVGSKISCNILLKKTEIE